MWKTKNHQFKIAYSYVIACFLVGSASGLSLTAMAAGTQQGQNDVSKGIPALEQRFFSREYINDPLEKRLERLELLVFGGTQDGSAGERLARLQKTIGARAQANSIKSPASAGNQAAVAKKPASSAQYPVLNTLEWRALKKTYPAESLDTRLGRLEKKLFGQDSPAMAYADRVERLQRTLAAGMPTGAAVGSLASQPPAVIGPAPKARPHGSLNQFGMNQFGFNSPPLLGNNGFSGGFGGGFGGLADPSDEDSSNLFEGMGLPSTFSQMFKQMNQQMAELSRLGPGQWTYDNNSGMWVEQNSGRRVKPGISGLPGQPPSGATPKPGRPTMPQLPGMTIKPFQAPMINPRKSTPFQFQQPADDSKLPPYADPNSI